MRMKKIMILAVAAIAMVACTKTYEVVETSQEQSPVGFGTWTDVLTKARTNGSTATSFANNEMFKVYGTKLVSSTSYQVFNGTDIKATVSESVSWNYNNTADVRYWDRAATSYTFYAALPGSMVTAYGSLTDEQKTAITNTEYSFNGLFYGSFTFDDPTAIGNDVLVASEKTVTVSDENVRNAVQLEFNHIASAVDLLAKKDAALASATVTVTGVKFKNIKKAGNFHVSAYSTTPTVAWSGQTGVLETVASSSIYSASIGGNKVVAAYSTYGTVDPEDANAVNTTTGDPVSLLSGYVFLPQELVAATQQILLSYTIAVGEEQPSVYTDVPVDLRAFMTADHNDNGGGSAITSWDPGKHYIYTITIGANAITFTATVNNWSETVNGYNYLTN